ncbi:MAG TPA: hypothetical protein VLD19_05455, partial [Chitinophagaceae bacterium]|nr:hypothetical protein [Chitinophagaceae bacterium]
SDKFPADFDDSLYHFVKRYDKLVRKGNAEPPVKDFALKSASGNDTTQAVLNTPGYTVLVFVRDTPVNTVQFRSDYSWLNDHVRANKKGALFIVTSQKEAVAQQLANKTFDITSDILVCDYVAVKTAGRNDVTIYILKDGTIQGKWAYTDFAGAQQAIEKMK